MELLLHDRPTSDCYARSAGDVAVTAAGELEKVADKVSNTTKAKHMASELASDPRKLSDNKASAYFEDDRLLSTDIGDAKCNSTYYEEDEYGNAEKTSLERDETTEYIHCTKVV